MSRADLLALTPESVATLANLGLVKRAQREIAAGEGPQLEEDATGIVIGRFKDGVITRLTPGTVLKDTPCTCGATTACRHRVATALAYPTWLASQTAAAPAPAAAQEPWSPAEFSEEALAKVLGARTMDRAKILLRGGVVVEVSLSGSESVPTARLPTCTVNFLVPHDLAYARCDCVVSTGCEHVAIAVWAFQRLPAEAVTGTVELGGKATAIGNAMDEAVTLAREVLLAGVAHTSPEMAQLFGKCRAALSGAGYVWPLTIVDELEQLLEAYRNRSARYSHARAALLLGELVARQRASRGSTELPPRFVLGADEAAETLLDHVRLVSLGARIVADDRERIAEVFLANPDTSEVLVARKSWTYAESETPEDGPALARRQFMARVTLGGLATGQVISKAVKRSANHGVVIGANRAGTTSVTPQRGDWEMLPSSLLVTDLAACAEERRKQVPRLLRPRLLADSFRVIAVKGVGDISYSPADQALTAPVMDANGASIRVTLTHRSVTPHALDALAAALKGPLRYVSGQLRPGSNGLEMEPVALVTDRMIIPDLAPEAYPWEAPHVLGGHGAMPLEAALSAAWGVLEEAAHVGLSHLRAEWNARVTAAADLAAGVELKTLAQHLRRLETEVKRLRDEGRRQEAAAAWFDALIWTDLARERL